MEVSRAVPAAVRGSIPTDGSYAFNRLFIDVRRYTRVSPSGRVNLRLLAGGWLGGDPLPLQRRPSEHSAAHARAKECVRNWTSAFFFCSTFF